LKANNILTNELGSFVKQNTSEIFKQNPNLAKISRKLTDVGAAINVIQQGGSLRKIKSNHTNIDMDRTFYHQFPQAETQIRSSLGVPAMMRGSGFFDDVGRAFKSIPQKTKEVAQRAADVGRIPTSVKEIQDLASLAQIPTDIGGLKRYGKTAITYAAPAIGSELGRAAGTYITGTPQGGYVGAAMGGIAGRVAGEQANKQIGDGIGRKRRGRPRKMSGGAMMDGLVKIPRVRGITEPLVNVPGISSGVMSGSGWFDRVLDTSFTPRQAIRLAKSVPALGREAIADIKGASIKIPKVRGITEPLVNVPGISSGVMPMSGRGARPAKGSPEMRERMARLRAMRRK
jgi:hypothetical protein